MSSVTERLVAKGLDDKQIGDLTGLKSQEIERRKRLAVANSGIRELLREGRCSLSVAEAAAKLPPRQRMMTMSAHIFFRLLAHAPEELQRQAQENARRAIPAFCFTEDDIRRTLVQEEGWDDLSDDEQHEAIERLMDVGEYEHAGATANQAITEAAANYLADTFLEKEQRQAGGEMTW